MINIILTSSRNFEEQKRHTYFVAIHRYHGVLGGHDPDLCAHFRDERLHNTANWRGAEKPPNESEATTFETSVVRIFAPKPSATAAAGLAIAVCMSVLASLVDHAQLGVGLHRALRRLHLSLHLEVQRFQAVRVSHSLLQSISTRRRLGEFLGRGLLLSVLLRQKCRHTFKLNDLLKLALCWDSFGHHLFPANLAQLPASIELTPVRFAQAHKVIPLCGFVPQNLWVSHQ